MTTKKSTSLTTVQAETGVKLDAGLAGGVVKCVFDTVAVATTDIDDNDIILLNCPVPSNSRIKRVLVYTDDLDSNGSPAIAFDVGLYAYSKFTSVTSGTATVNAADAVLDRDIIASASTVGQSASTVGVSVEYEARNIDSIKQRCWELLGYDADPHTRFNVALTVETVAATAVAGDITVVVEYVDC